MLSSPNLPPLLDLLISGADTGIFRWVGQGKMWGTSAHIGALTEPWREGVGGGMGKHFGVGAKPRKCQKFTF